MTNIRINGLSTAISGEMPDRVPEPTRLLQKLLRYLSKVAPNIFKSCPKVAHFTKKLLKSCFLSTQKNQFLLLMKVNLCTSIRIIYLFIYSFLLADISIPTEMIF